MRIGMGYDVHKLVPDRKLILCGVEIPHHLGLLGHSDADVCAHAIADALLGAAALGDIGKLFPDTDPAYEGADSMQLLKQVGSLLDDYGYTIGNVDATIIAQNPKLAPYRDLMRQNVARVLAIPVDCVSIKATTEEHLGFTGREEGIAAQAVCLLNEYSDFERSSGGCGGCCPMQQQ
ncbi:MAG: 2-C-methyl-D-erythritol 2,4-cyclodiphosphate synthase [Lachnospiraceae bacterium]|nr:2-C-methyl-D-erythritol 2,4-cyclodiphosphate synthase [Lachnospiraceae bacterium]